MTNTRSLPILTAAELLAAEPAERRDVLSPLLAADSAALVYGPPGVGKSFFALGIAWAVASGGSFLDWKSPRPHRVIYVVGGLGPAALRERLALFGSPPDSLRICPLDLASGPLIDLSTKDGLLRLMAAAGDHELIVVDAPSGHGDADRWDQLQRFLRYQRRRGRAVLLVQPANKEGTLHGSARRAHDVDTVIALTRGETGSPPTANARFVIRIEKAQRQAAAMVAPILAELERDDAGRARWSWGPFEDWTVRRVAGLLNEGLSAREAMAALAMSSSKFYRLRAEAQHKGYWHERKA